MNIQEAARSGWRDLWANKGRSALSFSAISVGVASLLYTAGQTRGMQLELQRNLELMGPGRMTIEYTREYVSKGLSRGLTSEDADAIREEIPGLYMVDDRIDTWVPFVAEGQAQNKELPNVRVLGVTPEFRKRDWVYKLRGRFLNDADLRHEARVCLLVKPGGWLHKPFWASMWTEQDPIGELVKHHDLLGKSVRLQDTLFVVVGVLELPPRDKDPRWESWDNPHVVVPRSTLQRYLARGRAQPRSTDKILVDTGDEKTIPALRRAIEALLRRRHRGEKDFEIRDVREEVAGEMENLKKYVKAGLALGVVALLAGGIGIMNVTLATIFSRVKEIGVRRAVGAGRGDILAQFLVEAAWLGVAGGLAGVALAAGGLRVLESWGEREVAAIAWYHCLGAVGLGAGVSAVFALFPAYQAAQLDPVEALRSE